MDVEVEISERPGMKRGDFTINVMQCKITWLVPTPSLAEKCASWEEVVMTQNRMMIMTIGKEYFWLQKHSQPVGLSLVLR